MSILFWGQTVYYYTKHNYYVISAEVFIPNVILLYINMHIFLYNFHYVYLYIEYEFCLFGMTC